MPVKALLLLVTLASGQDGPEPGRIEGEIRHVNGSLVPGVAVQIVETGAIVVTDERGRFSLDDVSPGTYVLLFSLGEYSHERSVVVEGGAAVQLDTMVDWERVFFESVTVTSASRRAQRIVEAPAAITQVGIQSIDRQAARSDVPQLLEFTPGVELAQEDIHSYNINTRGFNSTLSRRVGVFVDGRSTANVFVGSADWSTATFPLDDVESVEFVRGPSAALYGANTSSGVINLTTRAPRDYPGLRLRFALGERESRDVDVRFATGLGNDWFMKVVGRERHGKTFAVSRHESVEYSVPCAPGQMSDCLPLETFEVEPGNTVTSFGGGVRVDKYFRGDARLTMEGGVSRSNCCGVLATGAGRFLLTGGGSWSWARINLDTDRWNLLAYINNQLAPGMGSGEGGSIDQNTIHLEVQRNWWLDDGRWSFVGGALYERDNIQVFSALPAHTNRQAAYGQAERRLTDEVTLVVAARVEDATIHDLQFSPRVAVLWGFRPGHTLRFGYNQAFQAPSLADVFLQIDVAPPTDLSGLEGFCGAYGVSCGLGPTPVRAVGNPNLVVERTQSLEIGYRGLLGQRTLLTVDAYVSQNEDFITNLLPQVGTPFGRLNEDFGPWMGPTSAESTPIFPGTCPSPSSSPTSVETVADCVRRTVPGLSNDPDGAAVIPAVTFTNFGRVDTRGLELGVTHMFSGHLTVTGSATWFDFELQESVFGFENLLLPNAPSWQASAGATYTTDLWNASLRARWSDAFRWSSGVFVGDVPSYTSVDLDAQYHLAPEWSLGATIKNLLDDEHYQFFGAPILRRRAMVHVTYSR